MFSGSSPSTKQAISSSHQIVLQPSPDGGKLDIMLEGALSGLLTLALGAKRKEGLSCKTQAIDSIEELVLVAGVGFEPTTFRL